MGSVSFSVREYSGKVGTVNFNTAATGANTDSATSDAAVTALQAALGALTEGVISHVTVTRRSANLSNEFPTSTAAQRQNKIFVRYEDNLTKELGGVEIPVADIAAVTLFANTDVVDITQAPMSDLVTAMEAHVKSRAGNAITVLNALWVGRNL